MSGPSLPGYENLELIGKGGFSRVYRADQSKLKRKVAVKVLNFGLNDEADRVSFARETELMGRVSTHPNIVTVHDTAFTGQGQPCIVMEHYPGGSLADLINEVGHLNTREALEVGVAIASALEASHQSGVLHCDLKPQNILISEFGQPALGDFGISTFAEERTRTGKDAGAGFTLPYAAPEIVEGESPTVASDVYSLAATLYTSLSGRRPFAYPTNNASKPTAAEQARRILLEPLPTLANDGVPPELDALIVQSMSKDPSQRPDSAASFARACHQIGQALGLGTSAPGIADHGALRMIDTESVGQGQVDLSMLVRQRHLDEQRNLAPVGVPHDSTPSRGGFEVAQPEVSESRRRLAMFGAGLAIVIVASLLFMATRETSTDEPEQAASVASSSGGTASDPILAPTRPQDVVLERTGGHGLVVSWQVPAADLEAGDVTYEVRRQDGQEGAPWTTTTNEIVIPAVANDEGVCVTVLAVRANRTSSPTAPECSTPMTVDIGVSPMTCAAPCEATITVNSSDPDEPHAIAVVDRMLVDMQNQGFVFDETVVPSGSRWQLAVDESAKPDDYLIAVTFPDKSIQAVLFRVT